MSQEPGRAILATIFDDLMGDACLRELLEPLDQLIVHGSENECDQPETRHYGKPVRRYDQGRPGHFTRAVVCFGNISPSPYSAETPRWLEDWTFRAGVWAHPTVTVGSESTPGDLHALDVFDHVRRILAWDQTATVCPNPTIVLNRQQDGIVDALRFNEGDDAGWWMIVGQFRWTVIARGLRAPAPACC